MTTLDIEILKQGEISKTAITDDQFMFPSNLEKIFIINKAMIVEFNDGRYPQIQLQVTEPESGKIISIGTTFRLLNMVVSAAKGVASKQGLKDY